MADISQEIAAFEEASRGEEVRDAMVSLANKLNTVGPATTDWSTITNTPNTLSGYGVDNVPASMVSGVLGVENIPPSALERIVDVVDDTARFALTTSDVQLGDTVRVASTGLMYMVKDTSHLDSESGYQVYTAGTASAVPWSGVQNKPTTRDGYNLTDVYTKTETDNIVDDLENPDEHTVAAGNPITFETDSAQMAKATKITFEPIQDLHGYDHPWPAGGGKNKLQVSAVTQTKSGITFTVNSDGTIICNGTATDLVQLVVNIGFLFSSTGSYILSGCPSGGSFTTYDLRTDRQIDTGGSAIDFGSGVNFSRNTEATDMQILITIRSGYVARKLTFKPMIRLASEADATFAPYSNICPISGLDEVEVTRTGFNVWDEEWESGGYNEQTGAKTSNANYIRTKNLIHCFGGKKYYTFSKNSQQVVFYYYDSNLNYISFAIATNAEVVVPSNARWIGVRILVDIIPYKVGDICINISDPAKNGTYEPYQGYTASVDLPDTVYSGTLDLETGKLVADMGKVALNTLTFALSASTANVFYANAPSYKWSSDIIMVSSSYNFGGVASGTIGLGTSPNGTFKCYWINEPQGLRELYFKNTACATANEFMATLTADDVVVYELGAPITYQLTPQQLALFKGTNVVSTNASKVRVTYRDGQLALMEDTPRTLEIEEAKTDAKLKQVLGNFAEIEGDTVSKNYTVGSYLVHNGLLRKVTSAIASGESVTNSNSTVTTIADELALLWTAVNA